MKRCIPYLLAAVLGGALTLALFFGGRAIYEHLTFTVPVPTDLPIPEPAPLSGQALTFAVPAPDNREGWLQIHTRNARDHLNRGDISPDTVDLGLTYYDYGGIREWVEFATEGTQRVTVYAHGEPSKGGYPRVQLEVRALDGTLLHERKFTVHALVPTAHDLQFEAPAGPAEVHVYYMRGVFPEGKGTRLDLVRVCVEDAALLAEAPPQLSLIERTDPLIRQHRMGTLKILAAPNAPISVQQTGHHFRFGVNLSTSLMRDDLEDRDYTQEDVDRRLAITKEYFNSVTLATMYWNSTEKYLGQYRFDKTDRAVAWALENDMYTVMHTVFWGSDVHGRIRPWQKEMSDTDLRTVIRQRGLQVAERYKGKIDVYDFLNEIVHHKYYRFRMGDIVYDMVSSMLAGDPEAGLALNEFNIITHAAIDEYLDIARELLDMGVPLSSIGLQSRVNGDIRLEHAWDAFDRVAELGLPIHLSELDFVVKDEQLRARALDQMMRIGFAHPAVEAMTLWGLWDPIKWNRDAALWDKDWNRLPAGDALHKLLREEWWTQWDGTADAEGKAELRAFYGDYTVTVGDTNYEITLIPDEGTLTLDAR
ncbi:MAG: endo-1,4-beta-xylanase [Opitutales bacterium]